MNSRPLLDYLAYPDELADPAPATRALSPEGRLEKPVDALETRLKALEAMLRAHETPAAAKNDDETLAARIESILGRKLADQPAVPAPARVVAEQPARSLRIVMDPPPTAPISAPAPAPVSSAMDQEFAKFTEAVHLIGQAAKRFIEQPQPSPPPVVHQPAPTVQPTAQAPSTSEIEALSAVLRETVSAFRSVADDLAVSAGEIRNHATREERASPDRRQPRIRYHEEEDDILELRESVAELQDRLDMLMRSRRRARY
jgi:hypothetical protein